MLMTTRCRRPALALLALVAAVSPGSARAQTPVKDHYTVSGGLLGAANYGHFRVSGNEAVSYDWKLGWAAGAWLNFPLGKALSLEPQAQYSQLRYVNADPTATDLLDDGKASYLSLPLLLNIHLGKAVALSVGPQADFLLSVDDSRDVNTKDDLKSSSFALTAGIEFAPHEVIELYGRYVHGLTNMDNTGNPNTVGEWYNQSFQAGVKLKLFGKHILGDADGDGIADKSDKCPTQAGVAKYDGCPVPDTDRDGINDENDRCPSQAGVAKYQGCPVPDTDRDGIDDDSDRCPNQAGVAKYQGCPVPDTDRDGIDDDSDRCPTQAGVAKYQGCPVPDTDRDGINDDDDRCPTVAGTAAMNGCPAVEGFSAANVTFATGSARLTAQGQKELDKVVAYLSTHSGVSVRLDGHTDNTGSDRINQPLSQRRADAAREYLVAKGVGASRVSTAGHGSTDPVASNDTAAGRAQNRRVEVRVQ
jgi:outer membrane protein OmpA-like peptidoglycan-associated protein/opacity protein-like surface antigen